MARFRKKPVEIEAFHMTPECRVDNSEWPGWLHEAWNEERDEVGAVSPFVPGTGDGDLQVVTLEGPLRLSLGDWIIRGVKGELCPCKDDVFGMTYEPADADAKALL